MDSDPLARLEAVWKREQEKAAAAHEIEEHRAELYALCNQDVDLGIVYKRGGGRVEPWQARRMSLKCGRLCYYSEGMLGKRLKGWTHLHGAQVNRLAKDTHSSVDRDFCVDLVVSRPKARAFLLAFGSDLEVERFERLIALHRQFCEFFPQLVLDPP